MDKIEKVKQGLKCCRYGIICEKCPYENVCFNQEDGRGVIMMEDALSAIEELQKENKALRLLVDWATECDFGFDQFPEEYERYKDEITDMKYIEGMIHVAKRVIEDGDKND